MRSFNDDVWDAMAEAADEVLKKLALILTLRTESESFIGAREEIGGWLGTTTTAYLNQRNVFTEFKHIVV